MGTINYKCPNCRAGIGFDPSSGKFVCEYCQGVFTSEEMEAFTDGVTEAVPEPGFSEWEMSGKEGHFGNEPAKILPNMQLFSCPSCGAEIMSDQYTTASRCVYCGNNAIIASRLEGMNAPDYILPFSIDQNKAIQIYRKKTQKQKFIPKVFLSAATIEKIIGVYVPTWMYSGAAKMKMDAGAYLMRSRRGSGYTDYYRDEYRLEREGSLIFEKVPIDASKKMDDNLMRAIEPYPYKEMLPFDMSYLSGFLADRFDEDAEKRAFLMENRIEEVGRYVTRKSLSGFEDLSYSSFGLDIQDMKYEYGYLPVWLLTVNFKNKLYHFAINGRQGAFAGRFPVSNGEIMKASLKKALITAAGATILVIAARVLLFFA